jgi:hypothetical protein
MPNNKVTIRDIYEIVNRLEDKVDRRLCLIDDKINSLESFKDNLTGKIALLAAILSMGLTLLFNYVKEKLGIEK